MKKWVRRGIKIAIICAILLPMAIYAIFSLMPYLNLLPVMEEPGAMDLNNMSIVDREYNFTIESQFSLSNTAIETNYQIWEISGIYLANEYPFDNRTNFLGSNILITENQIDMTPNPLPNHNYTNENQLSINTTAVSTSHKILAVFGVWNTTTHLSPNLYNESAGATFFDKTIVFSTPVPQANTSLWISYESDQCPLVIEYYHKNVTFEIDLELKNDHGNEIILPAANFTVNFLGDLLGKGWISQDYHITPYSSLVIPAYLRMKNTRIFTSFLSAMLIGYPLELKAYFDAFIRIRGSLIDIPFFQITYPTVLDFPLPETGAGSPPFITFINRSTVSPNQPVQITVNATDIGTGISNRTYVEYSFNGSSWVNVTMSPGIWVDSYLGAPLPNFYPIPSTEGNDTYRAQIPGAPPGTNVSFKVYLEDYAGNIDHAKTANWIESEVYSYTVPSVGSLPEFTKTFGREVVISFFTRFFNYLDANGFNLMNYLVLQGINVLPSLTLLQRLGEMSDLLYNNDVDADYVVGVMFSSFDKAVDIMADSGVSMGALLDIFGLDFDLLSNYLMDHIHLPLESNSSYSAIQTAQTFSVLDDIEGTVVIDWIRSGGENITESSTHILTINAEAIGSKSMNWTASTPENLTRDLGMNTIPINQDDILTFWLDYTNYSALNGELSLVLIDNESNYMSSNPITFENTTFGTWSEIKLYLNSTSFTIDPNFNFDSIQKIQFSYMGSDSVDIFLDYICVYSPSTYAAHLYFLNDLKLTNLRIRQFLTSYADIMNERIIPLTDWNTNNGRTSYWNYVNLVATGNDTNYHNAAAGLLLEDIGVPNFFKVYSNLINGTFLPPGSFLLDTDIYPYSDSILLIMLYLGLAYVSYQAIKKELRKRPPAEEDHKVPDTKSEGPKTYDEPPKEIING